MLPSIAPYRSLPGRSFQVLLVFLSGALIAACAAQTPISRVDQQCNRVADESVNTGNWELARRQHEQLLKAEPGNCLALYHLGYIWGQLGERSQEVHFYEAAVNCGYVDDDRLFFNLGMAHADLGNTQQALDALERAVRLNPNNPDNLFGLGLMNQLAGRQAETETALLQALRLGFVKTW